MIDFLDCGVIQGSKLSGLLYTLYTNDHNVVNFVRIAAESGTNMEEYTNTYFKLLKIYYKG